MSDFPDHRALNDAIRSSAGAAYIDRSHNRGFSLNIFRINAQELIEASRHIRDPDYGIRLMAVDNKDAGQQAHREINRLVHNFVAGAMTLIDHTRAFMREHYDQTTIKQAYDDRVAAEFAEEPVSKFVQDLRNYMVHKGLPDSHMFVEFNNTSDEGATLTTGVRYESNALSVWADWTAPAREYIKTAGEFLDIHVFVEAYVEKVLQFHEWLDVELERFHAEDLAHLQALQDARAKLSAESPRENISVSQESASPVAREGEPTPLPFEFTDALARGIDEAGTAILARMRRLDFSARSEDFPNERPVCATITPESMLQTPVFWGNDADGTRVIAFLTEGDDIFGMDEEVFAELRPLAEKIFDVKWARDSLSQKFIEETALDWFRASFRKDNHPRLSDMISSESREKVRALNVWAPIGYLEVEAPFQFGAVQIAPITAQMFDELEAKGLECARSEQRDNVTALFRDLRSKMQGFVAVVVQLEAEGHRAQEFGLAIARDAVGLLRFFSPMGQTPWVTCPAALLGAAIVPRSQVLVLGEDSFSFSDGVIFSPLSWRLSKRELDSIRQSGLAKAAALISPDELSDFALAVRSSLLIYSTGTTLHNPADRLIYGLSSLEGILLKHSMEPTEFSVEERLSLLLASGASARATIAQNIREVYRFRRRHGTSMLTPHDQETLSIFAQYAHAALLIALENIGPFVRKADFIDAIDRRKGQ